MLSWHFWPKAHARQRIQTDGPEVQLHIGFDGLAHHYGFELAEQIVLGDMPLPLHKLRISVRCGDGEIDGQPPFVFFAERRVLQNALSPFTARSSLMISPDGFCPGRRGCADAGRFCGCAAV